jgi:hypothetical protein
MVCPPIQSCKAADVLKACNNGFCGCLPDL